MVPPPSTCNLLPPPATCNLQPGRACARAHACTCVPAVKAVKKAVPTSWPTWPVQPPLLGLPHARTHPRAYAHAHALALASMPTHAHGPATARTCKRADASGRPPACPRWRTARCHYADSSTQCSGELQTCASAGRTYSDASSCALARGLSSWRLLEISQSGACSISVKSGACSRILIVAPARDLSERSPLEICQSGAGSRSVKRGARSRSLRTAPARDLLDRCSCEMSG
eukprot:353970-Chlamydomonas_euryale.AAC.1